MGKCRTGDYKTNYIISRNPIKCLGDKNAGIEPCEFFKDCATELGQDFGREMAKKGTSRVSKSSMNQFFRFKLMQELNSKEI